MSISEKIKAINNKIEQISASLAGNVSEYEFFTGKDVFPEKDLSEKGATLKRFEYSKLLQTRLMLLKSRLRLLIRKEITNKLLKAITETDEKCRDKVENALRFLPKEQIEKYVEIDKRMKPEDLVYG